MSCPNHPQPSVPSAKQPPVAIIIVNWNGADDTISCLESLRSLDYTHFSVLVCDNASTDGSWVRILDWARNAVKESDGRSFPHSLSAGDEQAARISDAHLTLLQTGANLGFAGGNNRGLSAALARGDEYMWLLNPDTIVTPGALSALVTRCEADPTVGMCGSTLVYSHDRNTVQAHGGATIDCWRGIGLHIGYGRRTQDAVDARAIEERMDYVIGASMLVSSSFVRSIGLMDEKYFLYYEEADWAQRCRGQFRLGFALGSIVYHKEGGSIGTNLTAGHSALSWYYLSASSLRFFRKYFPKRLPLLTCYLCARAVKLRLLGSSAHSHAVFRALLGRPYRPIASKASPASS
jgi:GT2 family glycosyltransferase